MSTFDNNIMDWDSAIESDGSQFIVLQIILANQNDNSF